MHEHWESVDVEWENPASRFVFSNNDIKDSSDSQPSARVTAVNYTAYRIERRQTTEHFHFPTSM